MPDVRPNVTFTVTLTAQEFKLITRALAGLIHPGTKEFHEACALNLNMLQVRSAYIADLKKVVDGALAKAQEMHAEQPPGPTTEENP